MIAIVAFGLAHIPFWGVGFSLVADLPYGVLVLCRQEYEKKVTGLLARRFETEVAADQAAGTQWKQAAEVLRQGDHYLLVMLDAAIGSRLKRWWQFWR